MGIVFKPEPLPPNWDGMSLDEKRAWYRRVRADAVAAMERQRGAFPILGLSAPPPTPEDTDNVRGGEPDIWDAVLWVFVAMTFIAAFAAAIYHL